LSRPKNSEFRVQNLEFRIPIRVLALFLLVGCGRGFQAKDQLNELTGLHSKDVKYKSNNLVPEDSKFIQFIIADKATDTYSNVKQAVGFFDKGSLINATPFPEKGPGFLASPTHRKKHYSTLELKQVLTYAAAVVKEKQPNGNPVIIGSLSLKDGGPAGEHKSHQNGTDADVFYYSRDASTLKRDMVEKRQVAKEFDAIRTYLYVKTLVQTGRVIRILVDPAIKSALCIQASLAGDSTLDNETLRRLRPTEDHEDHMHIRTYCPWNSIPECGNQLEIDLSQGTGCPIFTAHPSLQ
jgi:murein endopeptidase